MTTQKDNNLRLRDILAVTPFSRKGREALIRLQQTMDSETFLKELYVSPLEYIKNSTLSKEDENYDTEDYEGETEYGDLVEVRYDKMKYDRLAHERGEFEQYLRGVDKAVYFITGTAGCGKTTYFRNVKNEMSKEKNVDFYSCDLEQSPNASAFLGVPVSLDNKNNVWVFIGYILNEVLNKIFGKNIFCKKSEAEHKTILTDIVQIYKRELHITDILNSHPDDEYQVKVFSKIEECVNLSKDDFCSNFGQYIRDIIKEEFQDNTNVVKEQNEKEAVMFVMGFIIRLFFCLSRMPENKGKKYICAIDSVEHYVFYQGKKRLQNVEIATIIEGIIGATQNIRPHIDRIAIEQNSQYDTFYGIIIMMRDTSDTIIKSFFPEQSGEYAHKNCVTIDISEWFDAKTITEKIESYFSELFTGIEVVRKAFDNVMSDVSPYKWGMHGMFTRMYNYNCRGIVDCLATALGRKTPQELIWFNDIWSRATNMQEKKTTELTHNRQVTTKEDELKILKHVCRQYVFRILLDYIEETEYFDRIMAATKKNTKVEDKETSYARKIATTLHNCNLEHRKKFISFPYLMKSVLVDIPDTQPSQEEITNFGNILYEMNVPDTQVSNWNALIEIQFKPKDNQEYSESTLTDVLKREWEDNKRSIPANPTIGTKDYGVRIRTSGSFFADIVPEFEYFACRKFFGTQEVTPYQPLFEQGNFKKNEKTGKYFFAEVIAGVRKQAVACVKAVIKREKNFIHTYPISGLYKKRNLPQVHPLRIFKQHIGYLENYKIYVKYVLDNNLLDSIIPRESLDKKEIENQVEAEIVKYKNAFAELGKEYSRYFNYTGNNK